MIYQLTTIPQNHIWIGDNFTVNSYLPVTNPLDPPWQWRGALVVSGVELNQGGGGGRICLQV